MTKKYFFISFLATILLLFPSGVLFAWDLSTASYDSKNCSVTTQAINPLGMSFSEDGTKLYVVNHSNDTVYQYTLSTAWDVSSCSYANKSKSVSSQDIESYGITFKSDGTKMYITGDSNDRVFQYSLSTAWDVSTATYDSVSYLLSSQSNWVKGITFKPDGTKMYITDWQTIGKRVWQYTLSTPWVVSSATYDNINFSYSSQVTQAGSTFFKPDGTKMYMIGLNNDTVFSYSLSTAWDVSTAAYDSVSFSVSSQEVTPWDVFFKPDGSKMYAIGNGTDRVYQYSITSDVTAPTITNVSSDKTNGSYTLGEVIDIDVTFSEIVTSTGNVTVTLETGATDRTCTFTVTSASSGTCNYTVQAGDATNDLTVSTISGTITDANSNAMSNFVPTTNLAANKAIAIDTTTPVISEVTPVTTPSTDTTPDYTFTTSEAGTISYGGSCSSVTTSASIGTNTITFSALASGTYSNCTITVTDAALNTSTVLPVTAFTIDTLAPVLSSIAATATSTGATITWTTDEISSSIVEYGLTDSYGSTTSETDTSPRVTSHSVTLAGLDTCKTYHYRVKSNDVGNNLVTGSDNTFTTASCGGGVGLPPGWMDFPKTPPTGYRVILNQGAKSTTSRNINLSFNAGPDVNRIAISLTGDFTDAVQDNYQSSMQLDVCSKFGSRIKYAECADGLYTVHVKFYTQHGVASDVFTSTINLLTKYSPTSVASETPTAFTKDLKIGSNDILVKALQKFLNAKGYIVAKSGYGSVGYETATFGRATRSALAKFQRANGIKPAAGYFGPATRAFINNNQ